MKRKITLFASALVLVFSAGAAQAHGSLFGIFFKHHWHDVCGNHHHAHEAIKACKHKHKPKPKPSHHHYGHHGHHHGGGHYAYPAKDLIW